MYVSQRFRPRRRRQRTWRTVAARSAARARQPRPSTFRARPRGRLACMCGTPCYLSRARVRSEQSQPLARLGGHVAGGRKRRTKWTEASRKWTSLAPFRFTSGPQSLRSTVVHFSDIPRCQVGLSEDFFSSECAISFPVSWPLHSNFPQISRLQRTIFSCRDDAEEW